MNNQQKYKWKNMYSAIKIDKGDYEYNGSLVQLLDHKMKDCELSFVNGMDHRYVFKRPYRRYRLGKNRCIVCGYKLDDKYHAKLYDK